jgi:3-methyladenine DNA glycosylase AlkD
MTAAEITKELERLNDDQAAAHSQRFFKTAPGQYGHGDVFRGIRLPALRALAKAYGELPVSEIRKLLRSNYHEDRLLALIILTRSYAKGDDALKAKIFDLYLKHTRFINNWDLVDCSAEHIVGPFLRDKDRRLLSDLAKSNSLWERRIAVLATFHYIKQHEFTETLKIARMLLNDEEDLIHKAVGWMLREVGKRDVGTEEAFLKVHYRRMPRTMLRYAIERFPEQKRQQYLKGTI